MSGPREHTAAVSAAGRPPENDVPGDVVEVATSLGRARAYVRRGQTGGGRLLLGHGAGGGVGALDLLGVAEAAHADGWSVALVEQPWRVAGRRVAVAPPRLDAGWSQVVGSLLDGVLGRGRGLVLAGRSAGARVACRTSGGLGASGVLCLAFPLHPPGRPERSRAPELHVDPPVLVVQGRRDPFGSPEEVRAAAPGATVVGVDDDHGLARDVPAVVGAVRGWLPLVRG